MGFVLFYYLMWFGLCVFLLMLIGKSLQVGWFVEVWGRDCVCQVVLDEVLWLGEGFLLYGLVGGVYDVCQLVLLIIEGQVVENQLCCLMVLDGVEIIGIECDVLDCVCILFDGNDFEVLDCVCM